MQAASIHDLKKELNKLEPSKVTELCLRLAGYKKDNKELLTYLLFESNEAQFVASIKNEIDEQFQSVNRTSIYFTKKGLRKILRNLDKNIRYSQNKETETELRIYFCRKVLENKIPVKRSKVLQNLYKGQIKKIKMSMSRLHEDLQFDYGMELQKIVYTNA